MDIYFQPRLYVTVKIILRVINGETKKCSLSTFYKKGRMPLFFPLSSRGVIAVLKIFLTGRFKNRPQLTRLLQPLILKT